MMPGQLIPKMNIEATFTDSSDNMLNPHVSEQQFFDLQKLFGKDSLENVILSDCITLEGITDQLRHIIQNKVQRPQIPFFSNFSKFK